MSPERSQYRISFEDVAAHAQEVTIQDGHHVPIVIVEGSKSLGVSSLQDLPETHDERLQMMHAFGQAAAMTGRFGRLQQVFFISEGWMSVAKRDGPPGIRPSQDPQRKEVLIVSGLAMQTRQVWLRLFEMVRDRDEKVAQLVELSPPDGREGEIKTPLLEAFVRGWRLAQQAQVN